MEEGAIIEVSSDEEETESVVDSVDWVASQWGAQWFDEEETPMYPHQLKGVAWMVDHETPRSVPRGGILADDTGLGKTVQMVAVVVSDLSMARLNHALTVVVCPALVTATWIDAFGRVRPEIGVRVAALGSTMPDLAELDVLVVSYSKMRQPRHVGVLVQRTIHRLVIDEGHSIRTPSAKQSKVLQEVAKCADRRWALTATPVMNHSSDMLQLLQFVGADRILGRNNYQWRRIVGMMSRDAVAGVAEMHDLLSDVMLRRTKDQVELGIGSITTEAVWLDFDNELERDVYMLLAAHARRRAATLVSHIEQLQAARREQVEAASRVIESDIMRFRGQVLMMMQWLRQASVDVRVPLAAMARGHESHDRERRHLDIAFVANSLERLRAVANQDDPEDCAVCGDAMADHSTECGHLFCAACINGWMAARGRGAACPMCRAPLADMQILPAAVMEARLARLAHPAEPPPDAAADRASLQSGIEALVPTKIRYVLRAITEEIPPDECAVVVTQWRSTQDRLAQALAAAGVPHCVMHGDVDVPRRQALIERFQAGEFRVALVTLMSTSTGVTMTRASHMFVMDPWWNPAQEHQMINRIHRIGQARPVRVHRLFMRRTIEQHMDKMCKTKGDVARMMLTSDDPPAKMDAAGWSAQVRLLFSIGDPSQ